MLRRFPLVFWLAAGVFAVSTALVGLPEPELPIPEFRVCDETGFLYTNALDDEQARELIMKLGLSVNPELLVGLAGAEGAWKKRKTNPTSAYNTLPETFVESVAFELQQTSDLDALALPRPCM